LTDVQRRQLFLDAALVVLHGVCNSAVLATTRT
jgi:hypothetical protein